MEFVNVNLSTSYQNEALLIGNVLNLVTKKRYWEKPTYDSLTAALYNLKAQIVQLGIKKLAIPRIGCGLDHLKWERVKQIICTVFYDTDIEILVCNI
ncbi:macro domain-containing protein [Acetanaerobacterium elongatum]|uniref:macro domain-containing protein n=1 Tax=Acetanaerobacterium elongatum TaxID=258515 RepID=UPI000B8655CA|nr:macro domain-containing protein [Acetanaerobacterium elongatum]